MLRERLRNLSVEEIGPEATLNFRGRCLRALDVARRTSPGYRVEEPGIIEVVAPGYSFKMVDSGIVAQILRSMPFEPLEVQYALDSMGEESTFVDVGANVGYYSLAVASKYPKSNIIAIEPCSWTFSILKRNIEINSFSNIQAERGALSDRRGEAELKLNCRGREGFNTIGKATHKYSFVVGRETVPVTTLSRLLGDPYGHGVDFIKVDVEGAELNVFRGAEELLSGEDAPTILYESQWQCTRGFGYHPIEIVKLLESYGYNLYVLAERFGKKNKYLKPLAGLDSEAVEGDDTSVIASKGELL